MQLAGKLLVINKQPQNILAYAIFEEIATMVDTPLFHHILEIALPKANGYIKP